MRKNGVPNFADPQFLSGGRIAQKIGPGVDPNSPTFQAAQQKCAENGGPGSVPPGERRRLQPRLTGRPPGATPTLPDREHLLRALGNPVALGITSDYHREGPPVSR